MHLVLGIVIGLFSISASKAKGPVFKPEAWEVNYGEIAYNSDGYRELYFTNTGDQPLLIVSCKSSCGCLVVKWPKEPLLPGDTAKFVTAYATKRIGIINKSFTVRTNEVLEESSCGDRKYRTYIFKVTGNVKKPIETKLDEDR